MYICAVYLFSALTIVELNDLNINGHTGMNVTFKCSDWKALTDITNNVKYFCYSPCTHNTHVIVRAESGKTKYKDRIHLNNNGKVLSVTFTDLHKTNSGTYYCGVERFGPDSYLKVKLNVSDAVPPGPRTTAKTASVVSLAVTHSFMSSNSSDIVTVSSYSSLHTTSTASGTPGVGSLIFLLTGLTVIIIILVVLLKLRRNMKTKKQPKVWRTDSPQENTQEEAEYHNVRFEDNQTQSSPVGVSTVHVFSDVPPDNLYANRSCSQETGLAANYDKCSKDVSFPDLQSDLVYSVAQLPKEQIKVTEQSRTNSLGSSDIISLYSLAQSPQPT